MYESFLFAWDDQISATQTPVPHYHQWESQGSKGGLFV